MIDPTDIQELIDKEPFEPFRIRMTDGHHFDVTKPALVVPMENMMFIALPKSRWKFLSYQNMTSIESEVQASETKLMLLHWRQSATSRLRLMVRRAPRTNSTIPSSRAVE